MRTLVLEATSALLLSLAHHATASWFGRLNGVEIPFRLAFASPKQYRLVPVQSVLSPRGGAKRNKANERTAAGASPDPKLPENNCTAVGADDLYLPEILRAVIANDNVVSTDIVVARWAFHSLF